MKIIGLTGGIASGKSTVARVLKDLGAILLDADELAHQVIEPHKPAWEEIVKEFGQHIINPDQSINRDRLGTIVFNDPKRLQHLNEIVHPRVIETYEHDIAEIRKVHPDAVVVMDVPLLFETHMEDMCDQVWVVWVDRQTQIERLMHRNNYTREEALARINSQMPLDEKARQANVVIDNSNSIKETEKTTARYFNDIIQDS
ncbi:MAG: dephospho-CoA kinase [Syntrophomonadaceae bacterium]